MAGSIDQVENAVTFHNTSDRGAIVEHWDTQIMSVCLQINGVVELMEKKGIAVTM